MPRIYKIPKPGCGIYNIYVVEIDLKKSGDSLTLKYIVLYAHHNQ